MGTGILLCANGDLVVCKRGSCCVQTGTELQRSIPGNLSEHCLVAHLVRMPSALTDTRQPPPLGSTTAASLHLPLFLRNQTYIFVV
jgi:hypothetical protein